jgi:hypothetical protein
MIARHNPTSLGVEPFIPFLWIKESLSGTLNTSLKK